MKQNQCGKYWAVEGEYFLEDPESKEKILFILEAESKLVVRSMLEEDIKPATDLVKKTNSQKRELRRILWNSLPEKNSQHVFHVAEKIIADKETKNFYSAPREIIGFGAINKQEIEINIYKHEENAEDILRIVKKVAKAYGIEGEGQILSEKRVTA